MSAGIKGPGRIFGLDVMRAAAISMVVLGHIGWILPKRHELANALLSVSGFLGVEMFFVLSGFLIGSILYGQFTETRFSFASVAYFLKRRWLRTLPNYFLVLLLNIALVFFVFRYEIDGLWRYFFFVQNFSSAMPAFFPESWSLSVEEFAYLILPLALLGTASLGKSKRSVFAMTVFGVYLFFMAAKVHYDATAVFTSMAEWNVHLKAVVLYRIDAICTGVLASWIALSLPREWDRLRWPAAVCGIVLLLSLCLAMGAGIAIEAYSFYWNVLFLPLTSLSFAALLPLLSSWKREIPLIGKYVTRLSLISYSAYLLHYSVVMQLLYRFVLPELGWVPTAAIYLLVTLLSSYLLYRFFEKPILRYRDSRAK